jgi:glyoxylase-like metal-dependent hydrolase (beta-lactamase superfamily II)
MFIRINPHLFLLQGSKGGRIPYANSLLIQDEITAIIDTGADVEDLERVAEEFSPDLVINTHFHIDHSRGNYFFPKAKIIAHEWDAHVLGSLERFIAATGLTGLENEYFGKFYPRGLVPYEVEGSLKDGDLLDFGTTKLRVIHTPGHTPGHLAFYHEEEEILFAGDIDLTSFGPWYGNPEANIKDFRESIKKVRDLKPRLVLSGHLEPLSENITERFNLYLEVLEKRDEQLLELLKEPKTMEEIVDAKLIYRKHPEPVVVYRRFEELMVVKHLRELENRGLLLKEGEYYRAC